ncbi:hypothetical protein ACQKDD_07115 [Planococcus kocurii]|uniref:hypothetical protein n=1 Tax=Planococcus kocurii TaxID=1374 RepID=UPI003CFD18A1
MSISIVLLIVMFTDFINLSSELPILIGGIIVAFVGMLSIRESQKGEGCMLLGAGLILVVLPSIEMLFV